MKKLGDLRIVHSLLALTGLLKIELLKISFSYEWCRARSYFDIFAFKWHHVNI